MKPSGGQDLTQGNVRKQLWSLAWPLMLSMFFYTLYNIVDAFWVSKLSAEAIAAVSISQVALFAMVALSMGISVGSGVIMAMHIGAKNIPKAERVLGQAFVLAGTTGIVFTIISLTFRHQILTAAGAAGLIFAPALEYFTITSAGIFLFFILMTIVFAFNSEGDTFTPTKLFALSTGLNIILDPILIFGWFGFPALGISGAAIATLISQTVFIVVALFVISGAKRKVRLRFQNLTVELESVKKVLAIGFPASLTQVVYPAGIAALTYLIASQFLEAGAVAFSLGFRIEFFAFLPAIGFGVGALAMIGQNMGAGNFDRAREALHKALKYGFVASTSIGILALVLAGPILSLFTNDPVVLEYSFSYITTVALSYGFLAALMVEANAFQGIGKSWPGFWLFLLKFVVITVPLAYILTNVFEFSIVGVWIAIVIGNVVSSAVGYVWITRTMKKLHETDVPVQRVS